MSYLDRGEGPSFTAGVIPTLPFMTHARRLLRGILPDFLLAFEEQPFPRQSTVLFQFLQPLILFLIVKLNANFDHTIAHKPHVYVCSEANNSR